MILQQKETETLKDLQTQEKNCAEKYRRYAAQAKDAELKDLFETLQEREQKHHDTIGQILNGKVPDCDCNDNSGKDYQPKATYSCDCSANDADKQSDAFLATDCICSEKLISSEYNTDVFNFSEPAVRKALADIQVEEQNHAEMLFKYKTVNCMP